MSAAQRLHRFTRHPYQRACRHPPGCPSAGAVVVLKPLLAHWRSTRSPIEYVSDLYAVEGSLSVVPGKSSRQTGARLNDLVNRGPVSFTALHPDAGRLDATDPELGCGLPWAAVYKVRPRVPLTCPDCGHGVHARRSSRGLRHFAHDPQRPEQCELAGESMEHHLLKLQLACAIRESGWHAELEVAAPDGTWRADVMASSPDGGRRIAWEAQLSAITLDDIRDRTERYFEAAVEVCWVTTRKETPWMGRVPSVRVDGEEGRWLVNDGIAGFDSRAGRWEVRPVPLGSLVVWVHSGRLDFHAVLPRYRRVLRPADGGFARRPGLWTSSRSVEAELKHERMRQRQEEQKQERLEREAEAERLRTEQKAQEERLRQEVQARQRARQERHDRLRHEQWQTQWELDSLVRRGRRALERRRTEHEREQLRLKEEAEERRRQEQRAADRAAGRAWWEQVSVQQRTDLAEAVTALVWKELATRAEINTAEVWSQYAYGMVVRVGGRRPGVFGVLRPLPDLAARCEDLHGIRVFVRNAREARLLAEAGLDAERITHFALPDFEQNTLC
ncbi:competence protein CoiA family protein [Kitasatospora herbaricolor]|uniref:competence protein CoiA family protein n=1 Tax=Kitasatospora herbaricolor TaxID=68217 RepID=UPI0036DDF475